MALDRRPADRVRRGLRNALRGSRDPAPVAGQRRRRSDGMGDLHTRKVLDLTIRLAEVMLSSGSGTADIVATAQDVAQAYRLTDCVVDIFVTTVIVSALPTADSPPLTIVRAVHNRSTDYTRLGELDQLIQRITSGGVTVDQAHEAMDVLTERPHPYPRWLATAGWAGFALGIAMLLGGGWLTCLLAAVTSAVIDQVGRKLNRIGTPFFFQHVVGAAIATSVAVAAYLFADLGPTVMVATGIVMLLSGLTLVGAMQDAVTGYMLTAIARLGEAVLLTSGIVVGILAGLQIAEIAGISIALHVDATESFIAPSGALRISVAVFGAALAGACLTVASYAPLRGVLTAGLVAGLAEAVLIALGNAGFGQGIRQRCRCGRRRFRRHADFDPPTGAGPGHGHRRRHADASGAGGLPRRVLVRGRRRLRQRLPPDDVGDRASRSPSAAGWCWANSSAHRCVSAPAGSVTSFGRKGHRGFAGPSAAPCA